MRPRRGGGDETRLARGAALFEDLYALHAATKH